MEFEGYKVGMELGIMDSILETKDSVEWYTIVNIDIDAELNVGFLYLQSNDASKNIHNTTITLPNGNKNIVYYADIIDTESNLIVLP